MSALQIAGAVLIGSTYLVLHWSLYMNAKRYQHWTLADTLDTTFRTRSDLRDFWTKMAFVMIAADLALSIMAVFHDGYCLMAALALFFLFKVSLMEILHRS